MEAIARPLRLLQEEIAWFTRATDLRLLRVATDATLRAPVLDLVMGYESHSDNRALFFRLEDPFEGAQRGWPARIQRLKDQLAEKTTALVPAGIHLLPLPEAPGGSAVGHGASNVEFAATLRRMARVLAEPLTQLVVVMAPVRIEARERFADELSALIGAAGLEHVRWVVVTAEADHPALATTAAGLGSRALSCSAAVDPRDEESDLAAMGAATVAELPGVLAAAASPRRWRAPGAMPDVLPPARVGRQPIAPSDEELVAAGLSPKFVNGGGEAMKKLVLGAALAMRQGKMADALTLQARAAAHCGEMNMPREQIINLHVLGGYALAAGQMERTRKIYGEAGELARKHALVEAQAQSELALGMLESTNRRPAEAAVHYSAAARLAETAKIEPLAIECWRMAGQLALDSNLEQSAAECWKRALTVAGMLDPALAQLTSAAEVARALAAVCRKRGLVAQAQALEQQSQKLDQGDSGNKSGEKAGENGGEQAGNAGAGVPAVVRGT